MRWRAPTDRANFPPDIDSSEGVGGGSSVWGLSGPGEEKADDLNVQVVVINLIEGVRPPGGGQSTLTNCILFLPRPKTLRISRQLTKANSSQPQLSPCQVSHPAVHPDTHPTTTKLFDTMEKGNPPTISKMAPQNIPLEDPDPEASYQQPSITPSPARNSLLAANQQWRCDSLLGRRSPYFHLEWWRM